MGEIDGKLNREGDSISVLITVFVVELGGRRGDQSSKPRGVGGGRGGEVRSRGGEDGHVGEGWGRGRGGVGGWGDQQADGEGDGEGDFVSVFTSVLIVELGGRRGDKRSKPRGVGGGRDDEVRARGGEDGHVGDGEGRGRGRGCVGGRGDHWGRGDGEGETDGEGEAGRSSEVGGGTRREVRAVVVGVVRAVVVVVVFGAGVDAFGAVVGAVVGAVLDVFGAVVGAVLVVFGAVVGAVLDVFGAVVGAVLVVFGAVVGAVIVIDRAIIIEAAVLEASAAEAFFGKAVIVVGAAATVVFAVARRSGLGRTGAHTRALFCAGHPWGQRHAPPTSGLSSAPTHYMAFFFVLPGLRRLHAGCSSRAQSGCRNSWWRRRWVS